MIGKLKLLVLSRLGKVARSNIIHAQPVRLNPNISLGIKGNIYELYGRSVVSNIKEKNIFSLLFRYFQVYVYSFWILCSAFMALVKHIEPNTSKAL